MYMSTYSPASFCMMKVGFGFSEKNNIDQDNSMYTVQVGKGAESQARGQLQPNIKVSPPSFSPMTMVPTAAMLLTKLLTL